MPRPGPRSYECVRRVWHSDTHQPLRATLTQEIFRVVTELHKQEIRNKKEWQEKLPTVVLKAEEILYSKAKSEEDYKDLSNLKARLDDAVNTMIRISDDVDSDAGGNKDGPYMEPCVEAALSLCCTAKVASRGRSARRVATIPSSALPSSSSRSSVDQNLDRNLQATTNSANPLKQISGVSNAKAQVIQCSAGGSYVTGMTRPAVVTSGPVMSGFPGLVPQGKASAYPGFRTAQDTPVQLCVYSRFENSSGCSSSDYTGEQLRVGQPNFYALPWQPCTRNSSVNISGELRLQTDELQLRLGLPRVDQVPDMCSGTNVTESKAAACPFNSKSELAKRQRCNLSSIANESGPWEDSLQFGLGFP